MTIGGTGKVVQINETIVIKGMKVTCFMMIGDKKFKNVICIMREVQKDDPNRFFVVYFVNRSAEAMKAVLERQVAPGK